MKIVNMNEYKGARCAVPILFKERLSKKRGFTLIEILLIVVLLAIVAGLVIPRLGGLFFDYGFTTSVKTVDTLIQYAHNSAIYDNTVYKVIIDDTHETIKLEKYDANEDKDANFISVAGSIGRVQTLPEQVSFDEVRHSEIYFYPDGRCTKSKFVIKNESGKQATFASNGLYNGMHVIYA